MVKLTGLYNLKPGADHEAFVKWRTTPDMEIPKNLPGLKEAYFYRIQDSREGPAPYRYMSELIFPDQETFEKAFYAPAFQEGLKKAHEDIVAPLFLISDQLIKKVL